MLLLACAAPAAEPPGQLAAGDLLAEMTKVGQGVAPAGIYAWRPGGVWRRVVLYGRHPRWSPARDRVLFFREGTLFTLRVGKLGTSPYF